MQPNRDRDFDPNTDDQADGQGVDQDQNDTDDTASGGGAHRTERPAR